MNKSRALSNLPATAALSAALVLCTWMFTGAMIRVKNTDEMIRVVGSARREIHSDLIIWKCNLTFTAPTTAQAYQQLGADYAKLKAYLLGKGIPADEIVPAAIAIKTLYVKTKPVKQPDGTYSDASDDDSTLRPVAGYELSQEVEVRSNQVALVDDVSRQVTELLSQGVHLESESPMYIYTKMSDLKVSMQAEAARDARARADQIAINTGCRVGGVRFARMSVPEITPLYSTEASDGGVDDTTSLDKKITAVVTAGFSIR